MRFAPPDCFLRLADGRRLSYGFPEADGLVLAQDALRATPVSIARYVAASLPRCEATFFPGEGHFVAARHWDEIVATLAG